MTVIEHLNKEILMSVLAEDIKFVSYRNGHDMNITFVLCSGFPMPMRMFVAFFIGAITDEPTSQRKSTENAIEMDRIWQVLEIPHSQYNAYQTCENQVSTYIEHLRSEHSYTLKEFYAYLAEIALKAKMATDAPVVVENFPHEWPVNYSD